MDDEMQEHIDHIIYDDDQQIEQDNRDDYQDELSNAYELLWDE